VLKSLRNPKTPAQQKKSTKDNQKGGANDRFSFSCEKEEKMEGFQRTPCKIFFEEEGQLYEATQVVSYDCRQAVTTVHVERKVVASEARPTPRMDLLEWFYK
jgi:hypothetical protein